jgi:hypothetical protein
MTAARRLEIEVAGNEDAATTFAREQLMMLRCAADSVARARVWRRPVPSLSLGRFHRAARASSAWASGAEPGISRRLSGGRVVPLGSGVLCITIAAETVDWFDAASKPLKPEQVLNRALRPLLAMLRGAGADAFYPGRDLVTAGGRIVAHASFTVLRDGVCVVEMHVAERDPFASLPALLDATDPDGVAALERDALSSSAALTELGVAARSDAAWAHDFANAAGAAFGCETAIDGALPADVTPAHESALRDFAAETGPLDEGCSSAAVVAMLGVVECSARMRGDRIAGLRLTGDLIAPYHTIDDVSTECEGEPLRPANVRKALARVMARPRNFVLGLREIDELILRLA